MKKSYQRLEDNSTNTMKQVKYRNSVSKLRLFGSVFLLAFSLSLFAQDGDPAKGKSLFNTNCAACHNLDKKMTGPALRGVEARLANDEGLDRNWLNSWIRNSSALIKSGDTYANKIYAEYNGAAMTANKYQNVRAGLCWTKEIVSLIKQHNNANVLCLGARVTDPAWIINIVDTFLTTEFEGGRHEKRIEKL